MPPSTGAAGTSTLATAAQAQATCTAVITFSLLTTLCFLLFFAMNCWFCVSLSKHIYPLVANGLNNLLNINSRTQRFMYPYNTDVVNVSHSEYPQHVKELYSLYDLISDAKLLIYPLMAKHSNNNIGTI